MSGEPKKPRINQRIGRREFLAGAGMAAASVTIMKPQLVRGTQANSRIALGMIGCGQRGAWIADLCMKHGGYQVVAGADYFQDRVDAFGENSNWARSGVMRVFPVTRSCWTVDWTRWRSRVHRTSIPSRPLRRWVPGCTYSSPNRLPWTFRDAVV